MTPTEMHIDALMEKIKNLEADYYAILKTLNIVKQKNARYREALELIVDKYFDLPEDAKMYKGLIESKESLIAREALKGD